MNILVAGDYCPIHRLAPLIDTGNFEEIFGEVKPILKQIDYSIVNLESPVVSGVYEPIKKWGPNIKCTEAAIQALKWTGFNCVTLANNHFYDFGDGGVFDTLAACRKFNIDTVGGGVNILEASKTLYKNIGNKRLAIINCCEHEFSVAGESSAGSNPLNPIKQYYSIRDARSKADVVIVIIHGGHEHFQLPSPRMVETYRFFVDSGADAVINHHQHCYSGYEVYKQKPIFYGLGNFCFDRNDNKYSLWNEGYAVKLEFSENKTSFTILQYCQCNTKPRVQILHKEAYNDEIDRLNTIICNGKLLKEKVYEYYRANVFLTKWLFEPIRNGIVFRLQNNNWLPSLLRYKEKLMISNHLLCESLYDRVKWWLEK